VTQYRLMIVTGQKKLIPKGKEKCAVRRLEFINDFNLQPK